MRKYTEIGEKHGSAKLPEDGVREIRRLYANGGISQQKIATKFGVTRTCIAPIVQNRAWTHVK